MMNSTGFNGIVTPRFADGGYNPYEGDYLGYGYNPEHRYFSGALQAAQNPVPQSLYSTTGSPGALQIASGALPALQGTGIPYQDIAGESAANTSGTTSPTGGQSGAPGTSPSPAQGVMGVLSVTNPVSVIANMISMMTTNRTISQHVADAVANATASSADQADDDSNAAPGSEAVSGNTGVAVGPDADAAENNSPGTTASSDAGATDSSGASDAAASADADAAAAAAADGGAWAEGGAVELGDAEKLRETMTHGPANPFRRHLEEYYSKPWVERVQRPLRDEERTSGFERPIEAAKFVVDAIDPAFRKRVEPGSSWFAPAALLDTAGMLTLSGMGAKTLAPLANSLIENFAVPRGLPALVGVGAAVKPAKTEGVMDENKSWSDAIRNKLKEYSGDETEKQIKDAQHREVIERLLNSK